MSRKIFYKIRHIQTGLFYKSNTGHTSGKRTHLDKLGQRFEKLPKKVIKDRSQILVSEKQRTNVKNLPNVCSTRWQGQMCIICHKTDFEIVTYEERELSSYDLWELE